MTANAGGKSGNGTRVLASFIGGLPWAIATIFAIGFGYSRIQSRLDEIDKRLADNYPTRAEIVQMLRESDRIHSDLDKRLDRLESMLSRRDQWRGK